MRSHRATIAGASLALAMAASALAPTAAQAGPLLSGYGGPGAGNQAILGSALLNGPSAGGGSGGEGASAGSARATGGATLAGAGGEGAAGTSRGALTGGGKRSERPAGKAAAGASRPPLETATPTSPRQSVGSAPAPLLSAVSLVYVLFALGALVLTGALTRRLTRQPG
jgi:hypothetical protein